MRPHQTIASTGSILRPPCCNVSQLEWLIYLIKRCLVYKVRTHDKVARLESKPSDQRRDLGKISIGYTLVAKADFSDLRLDERLRTYLPPPRFRDVSFRLPRRHALGHITPSGA
jgi:hypothetical protein